MPIRLPVRCFQSSMKSLIVFFVSSSLPFLRKRRNVSFLLAVARMRLTANCTQPEVVAGCSPSEDLINSPIF